MPSRRLGVIRGKLRLEPPLGSLWQVLPLLLPLLLLLLVGFPVGMQGEALPPGAAVEGVAVEGAAVEGRSVQAVDHSYDP